MSHWHLSNRNNRGSNQRCLSVVHQLALTKVRDLLIAGEKDLNLNNIKSLHELLTTHGMDCQLIVASDIAHDFPADFDQILAQAGPSTWTNKEPSHPISA
ncbi:MAG TPA: hypothetical protein VLA72_08515 [Anaerolineales bacterium]|nr:hypothetical protein [Anaerolineales bacterium]